MEFGPVPVRDATGAVLAHSLMLEGRRLRKGRVLAETDIAALAAAGIAEVTVARLGPGDVGEDSAAGRIAAALAPAPAEAGLRLTEPFTGRVNLHAERPGVLGLDRAAVDRLNALDPAVTLATLPPLARVTPGTMVGTVKIITYAVPGDVVARAERLADAALTVHPVTLRSATLILTATPGQPDKLAEKGRRAVASRLDALGIALLASPLVAHRTAELSAALAAAEGDLVLVLTGSATSDPNDVGPAALVAAGGRLTRFGMPVDPGNLLFLGEFGGRPIIGLPGCARSPALNGADWVMERIACGLDVTDADIAAMGVGGLLTESPARPHPRDKRPG